jgi:hypothetical protein
MDLADRLKCFVFIAAVVIATAFIAPASYAVGTYLLDEKFNDMTTNSAPTNGWTSFATSGSVQVRELPFAVDKSVRIEKTNQTTNASGISRTLPNYSGKVAFEAKVLMRETAPFHVCPYVYDSTGALPVVSIGFSNGNIVAFDKASNSFQNIQTFATNDWYMIRVVINTLIKDVLLNVDLSYTHDGIDIVDCHHTVVEDCTVYTGDDSFCPKTGIRRGGDDLLIKDCFSGHAGANGYKFGTASYGGFNNALIQDCYVKNATYAAMVVMSRNGADVSNINFSRLEFSNCGAAFFVFLGQQPGHPDGDVDKLGSIDNVHFTDILCSSKNSTSNKWGSNITGQIYNNITFPITNLFFTNCNITFKGGDNSVPGDPPEWDSNQYPEVSMGGDLPAYGYWIRHVNGVTFTNCVSRLNGSDARLEKVTNDVTGFSTHVDSDGDGMPDDWEQYYFGLNGTNPNDDSDGDGVSNYGEYVTGTNPTDPTDHFGPMTASSDGTTITLTFKPVPLKRYIVEYSTDLTTGGWTQMAILWPLIRTL